MQIIFFEKSSFRGKKNPPHCLAPHISCILKWRNSCHIHTHTDSIWIITCSLKPVTICHYTGRYVLALNPIYITTAWTLQRGCWDSSCISCRGSANPTASPGHQGCYLHLLQKCPYTENTFCPYHWSLIHMGPKQVEWCDDDWSHLGPNSRKSQEHAFRPKPIRSQSVILWVPLPLPFPSETVT